MGRRADGKGDGEKAVGGRWRGSEIVVRLRGTKLWEMAKSVAEEGKETMAGQRGWS